jgi:F-type H+-transporting ATPase subunit gamma
MLNTRAIRRKIGTVENVKKITTAMQMVAAARLRRMQSRVASGRPYAEGIREVTQRVVGGCPRVSHPLLAQREPVERLCLCVAGSARGLCGSFNPNLFREVERFLGSLQAKVVVVTLGRKARQYFRRRGHPTAAAYDDISGEAPQAAIARVARELRSGFEKGEWDELWLAYNAFVSAVRHTPTVVRLLPITPPREAACGPEYLFEPPPERLLDWLLPRYFETVFYHALLESSASEHGARAMAMRIATDNAEEMLERLQTSYHKTRQALITKELLEVVGSGEALRAQTG